MTHFYGWDSTACRLEPLQGGSLLFTESTLEPVGHCTIKLQHLMPFQEIKALFNNF